MGIYSIDYSRSYSELDEEFYYFTNMHSMFNFNYIGK